MEEPPPCRSTPCLRPHHGAEPGAIGRFFDERDSFAYQLYLAKAFMDHIWNYDPVFGSRVVPVFAAIGRNLDLLFTVDGIGHRIMRMVGAEKAQPNGPLFELLVAAAYLRAGGKVSFVPEQRGGPRTHDLDVELMGRFYAIECKRMEVSELARLSAPALEPFGHRHPPISRVSYVALSPRWSFLCR